MKLLLPIDGSDCSKKTLEWAIETFNRGNTSFYLLSVIPLTDDMVTVEYEIATTTKHLNETRTWLEQHQCKVAQSVYILGNPVEQICQYAEEIEADQVVIGSHGRSGLVKLALGSVSVAVMEKCRRSVIIYRNVERKPAGQTSPEHTPLY